MCIDFFKLDALSVIKYHLCKKKKMLFQECVEGDPEERGGGRASLEQSGLLQREETWAWARV